jgi:hypothetical protein
MTSKDRGVAATVLDPNERTFRIPFEGPGGLIVMALWGVSASSLVVGLQRWVLGWIFAPSRTGSAFKNIVASSANRSRRRSSDPDRENRLPLA